MRRLALAAPCMALAALLSCAQPAAPAPIAPCQPLPGAEALLATPAARLIVIGADAAPEAAALLLTACAALTRGERVAALLPIDAQWDEARAALAGWAAQGAQVVVAALPAHGAQQDLPATQADLAAALTQAASVAEADRAVALVDSESAARRPLGLSGATWAPAGALLPSDEAVTLRAMGSPAGEPRLSLGPFEDVTPAGAARAYDGLITLPMTETAPPEEALRGRI